ncbi:MAG: LacI family transcriptional regulator [Actinobacteria bacterium]|nr:LacI family transcriptional regulator [Actinomycetota bacterium]
MVSLRDVAERAGVSPATASRVLSDSTHPVREGTRQLVLDAARDLDFHPNMLARGLVTARTHVLGVIVHDISDPYFGEIVRGVEDAANLRDHRVFVCSSDRDPERELAYVRALMGHRTDAILFAGGVIEDRAYQSELRRLLNAFKTLGGVVVMLAPHVYRSPSVTIDNAAAAWDMTSHLLELGHRRIGFVAGPERIRTSGVRLTGHREALERSGLALDPALVESGGFTTEGGAKAATELVGRRDDVTAIFAANDVMAFGVLHALAGLGIRVPKDVSVAGFDDIQLAGFATSPLTTVRVPMSELGQLGAQMALNALAGNRIRSVTLPTEIVVRASTAPPDTT